MAQLKGDAGTSSPLIPDRKAGVWGESDSGYGVAGTANTGNGVQAGSISGFGAVGTSATSIGVLGSGSTGIYGHSASGGGYGVYGVNDAGTTGVLGSSSNIGVGGTVSAGTHSGGTGVAGFGGSNTANTGVYGESGTGAGVYGRSQGIAVIGDAGFKGIGVLGVSGSTGQPNLAGSEGAIVGFNDSSGTGVFARSASGYALRVRSENGLFGDVHCARFEKGTVVIDENLDVHKTITAAVIIGFKFFKIDHPLDPANRYLYHACVESPERKNVYDGVISLDANGEAVVKLPEWFGAVNCDFRYQLTPLGRYAPVYIAQEIIGNAFRIAGGEPEMRVSWQVTGVRHGPLAKANPMVVEEDKPPRERGYYQDPEVHGQPPEKGIRVARDAEFQRRQGLPQIHISHPASPAMPAPPARADGFPG